MWNLQTINFQKMIVEEMETVLRIRMACSMQSFTGLYL